MTSYRRIVTGFDANGKSCVVADSQVGETGAGNFHFWMTRPGAAEYDGSEAIPFFPGAGQTAFRIVRLPPLDPAPLTAGQAVALADGFFAELGDPWCRADTTRHPLMHRTPTTDYITILSGQVSLLLETGEAVALQPMDSVVQRRTNHMWVVTGPEPATFLCVMVGDAVPP